MKLGLYWMLLNQVPSELSVQTEVS
jgi:hypothetical protein